MKILYVAHSGDLQGAGLALINIIKGCLSNGITPVVVLPYKGRITDELDKLHVKYYIIKYYNQVRLDKYNSIKERVKDIFKGFRTVFYGEIAKVALSRIVRKECPQIIHTNTGVIHFSSSVARKFGIPHVWHMREFQYEFNFRPIEGLTWFKEEISKSGNHCIAITNSIFDYWNLSDQKDCMIYDGVFSASHFSQFKESAKSKYFLFVGKLSEGKGVYDLLKAFELYASQNKEYELWLAGYDGVGIEDIIAESKYSQRIKYLGFRSDTYELMAHATALIVPSFFEGFGFITAEAMANYCLVIGRNTAGTKEQFDNGLSISGSEIALRFDTVNDLVEKMIEASYSDLENMKVIAYNSVKKLYTIESNAKRLISFYKSIV